MGRGVRVGLLAVAATLSTAAFGGTLPGAKAGPAIGHAPRHSAGARVGSFGWASSNWSGHAITGSTYASVTAQWTVPTVSASNGSTYSSAWVGIDGFNNSSLIQTGTEQDYYSGSAHYSAWWEILPATETVIPSVTVRPGDVMTAKITQGSGTSSSLWTITISDVTGGTSYTTTQTYSGPQTSAEWILEAPTVGGHIAKLARYGHTTFDPGTANGVNPGLVSSDGGYMVQRNQVVSVPSDPDSDTDGFNVAYGNTQPSPPAS